MQEQISRRVEQIQSWLTDNNLDAFIVAHEDEYLGEYVPAHNERLHWLTQSLGQQVQLLSLANQPLFLLMVAIRYKFASKFQQVLLTTATLLNNHH